MLSLTFMQPQVIEVRVGNLLDGRKLVALLAVGGGDVAP
jgi:hypothetical protein